MANAALVLGFLAINDSTLDAAKFVANFLREAEMRRRWNIAAINER
jgi:hypothetical protein